jgi:hypothetical protein
MIHELSDKINENLQIKSTIEIWTYNIAKNSEV